MLLSHFRPPKLFDEILERQTPNHCISINPLYTCDSLMRTFSDSEYSDEMQRYEAFYQCLH